MVTRILSLPEQAPRGARWLVLARLLLLLLSFCVLLVRTLVTSTPETLDVWRRVGPPGVYFLLIGYALIDLGYLALLRFIRQRIALFIFVQLVIDVLVVTALVFLTGGTDSHFLSLFFLIIMASAMLLRRATAFFALLATIAIGIVTALYATNTGMAWVEIGFLPARPPLLAITVARMLIVVTAFFVVGYLSELLAVRLETARSLNEEILQNMEEGVGVFDRHDRLVFWNREFETLFSPHRVLQFGESIATVFPHPEDLPLRRLLLAHTPGRMEFREQRDLGRPPLEVRVSPLGNPQAPHGMVMLAIDLSLLKRAETAERWAERFAAINEMAASLAHEIRNPLASIRGSIQEISAEFPPESTQGRLAAIILKESARLDTIMTNFLQFARQRSIRPIPCRLAKIFEDIVQLLRRRPEAAEVEIDLHVNPELQICCDPEQMREVFLNLGVNALAAMNGKGRLEIDCLEPQTSSFSPEGKKTCSSPGRSPYQSITPDFVTIVFRDTGPGIPPGMEEKIFEPFFTTKATGSGLGLAIGRRIVQSHEGELWAENRRDRQGAVFYCRLPIAGPYLRENPSPRSSPSPR